MSDERGASAYTLDAYVRRADNGTWEFRLDTVSDGVHTNRQSRTGLSEVEAMRLISDGTVVLWHTNGTATQIAIPVRPVDVDVPGWINIEMPRLPRPSEDDMQAWRDALDAAEGDDALP